MCGVVGRATDRSDGVGSLPRLLRRAGSSSLTRVISPALGVQGEAADLTLETSAHASAGDAGGQQLSPHSASGEKRVLRVDHCICMVAHVQMCSFAVGWLWRA